MELTYIGILDTTEVVQYLQKDDKYLYLGGCTNIGFKETDKFLIDDCFSIDENIQGMIEELNIKMYGEED